MGDQRLTTGELDADGRQLGNIAETEMHDLDGDGCRDLIMSRTRIRPRAEAPVAYWTNESGQFQALSHEPFANISFYAVPADVNGDAMIDFVVAERDDGPDGLARTDDDFSVFTTHLNTTPAGLVRCRPGASNRPPVTVGRLASLTISVGEPAVTVDVTSAFRDPDGDVLTYGASGGAADTAVDGCGAGGGNNSDRGDAPDGAARCGGGVGIGVLGSTTARGSGPRRTAEIGSFAGGAVGSTKRPSHTRAAASCTASYARSPCFQASVSPRARSVSAAASPRGRSP